MTADLTVPELEAFTEQVLETVDIPTADGAVYLRVWHEDIAFFTGTAKEDFERQGQALAPPSPALAAKGKHRRGHER